MPTTRKQKKTRKSRGLEMLSDIEYLDIKLGENHFNARDRDENVKSNQSRRPESAISNKYFENTGENTNMNQRTTNSGFCAEFGQNSASGNSSAEINRLSSELNSRLSRELDEIMCGVNTQIQRAISDAISSQILHQIQTALNAGSGNLTQNRWNVPSERPEFITKETYGEKVKTNSRCEQRSDHLNDGQSHSRAYNMVTEENESPIQVPEFLTGRIPSISHLNQSYGDLNLDTAIPAHERTAPAVEPDPISRLADVLTSMQNRPTAQ